VRSCPSQISNGLIGPGQIGNGQNGNATKERTMPREYVGEQIAIGWEPKLCIHAAECVRGMPEVFDTQSRPWVTVENAFDRADELAGLIARCPSGALSYRRLDDGPAESPDAADDHAVHVAIQPDGPLYVRGDLTLKDAAGGVVRDGLRVALCRCGDSQNKPFCDNSHIAAGFAAP